MMRKKITFFTIAKKGENNLDKFNLCKYGNLLVYFV